MIVDAYAHCGKSKYLPVEQVLATMKDVGIARTVLCQHFNDYDNSYLSEVVRQYPDSFTAVCLIDPGGPDALGELKRHQETKMFRGVRLLAEWLGKDSRLWLAAMDLGMNLVVYAPDGIKSAVQDILDAARGCPSAKIIISHLGNPKVVEGRFVDGYDLVALAEAPNVYVQLSGQAMFCEYPYSALDGFIADVVKRFGPGRVMWGSTFPVCGDSRAISKDLALVKAGAWGLDQDGIDSVTGRTAMQVWFSSKQGDAGPEGLRE